MFLAPAGDRIGKQAQALTHSQADVLYLHITVSQFLCISGPTQQNIDPAPLFAVGNFCFQLPIALQLLHRSCVNGLQHQSIRPASIDAQEIQGINFDNLPAMGLFSFRIAGSRLPDYAAGRLEILHRSGIGTMHGYHLAVVQLDVGEKALISLDEFAML